MDAFTDKVLKQSTNQTIFEYFETKSAVDVLESCRKTTAWSYLLANMSLSIHTGRLCYICSYIVDSVMVESTGSGFGTKQATSQ